MSSRSCDLIRLPLYVSLVSRKGPKNLFWLKPQAAFDLNRYCLGFVSFQEVSGKSGASSRLEY